jgi:hypothetical protein
VWRAKEAESAAVKHWKPTLAILMALSASFAVADDFRTTKGKEYKNATVSRVEPDGIVIKFKGGIVKILFTELPKDVQLRFGYDTDKIEAEQEKRIQEQRAAEEKRIDQEKAAERERAEREKNAEADLKRGGEKFKAAEQRAKQAYQNAPKGTLSGQVFVSTGGGDSVKLGAVQVQLFAREAIDVLVAAAKNCADVKIQQLSGPVAEAKAALDQAKGRVNAANYRDFDAAQEARDAAQNTLDFFYSGAFYFAFLHSPIQTAETDADGRFAIEVPTQGSFVIAAQAERHLLREIEHYYWLQPVSLEGQQQSVQNLSNKNLTSTTGTSSLIHTQDFPAF